MTKSIVPEKLKDDSIIEALCEVRFHTAELPEIAIGRLSDHEQWKGFTKNRLPAADIPGPIRAIDDQLKYQPVLELRSEDGTHLVKVGSNVISYHNIGKYCGWKTFEPALARAFAALFACVKDAQVNRLGFRYVNAITSTRHYMSAVSDLELRIEVAGVKIDGPINLNYVFKNDESHLTMTRIASPDFVQGKLPSDTTVVVDIDVSSPKDYMAREVDAVTQWVKKAHDFEKQAFFKLIPKDVLAKLEEK